MLNAPAEAPIVARRRIRTAYCVIAGVIAELIAAPAAFLLFFLGVITYSGCFIECTSEDRGNPALAMLEFAGAALLAPAGLWVSGLMARNRAVLITAAGYSLASPLVVFFVLWT